MANTKNMVDDNLPSSQEVSPLIGACHLKRLWVKIQWRIKNADSPGEFQDEWATDVAVLDMLGVGLEESMIMAARCVERFDEFEQWVLMKNGGVIPKKRVDSVNRMFKREKSSVLIEEPILTDADLQFWDENGYVILRQAVSEEDCRLAEAAVCNHLKMDANDPKTWYENHSDRQGIMVQLFQHEALERNRFSEKIRKAYVQLWASDQLVVSNDRVSFNPPETDRWKFPGPNLHWDVSLASPIPFGVQGLLYLTDTTADQGAFQLVPGFHHKIEHWLKHLPDGVLPRTFDLASLGAKPIAGNAGDFIIWHQALPHGSGKNTATRPRIVQYINWLKVDREIHEKWV